MTNRRAAARRAPSDDDAHLRIIGQSAARSLDLDPVIHNRMRLAMLAALSVGGEMSFTDLRQACDATDGNLASHTRRLGEAGYLRSIKNAKDRPKRTTLRLTARGKRALSRYLEHMRAVIDALD